MKKSSMKKSIALGLALAMGTSLLTACGGSATTSSSEAIACRLFLRSTPWVELSPCSFHNQYAPMSD